MSIISKITAAATVAAALIATAAYASGFTGAPSIGATASATVIVPVQVSQTTALSFGTFSASPTQSGTIDSSGNVTGGVSKVTAGTPASFTTQGESSTPYTIVGDPTVTLTDSVNSGNAPMVATLTYPSSPRTLSGANPGSDSFPVSAVLAVGAGQGADPYTGTYNVSVHY